MIATEEQDHIAFIQWFHRRHPKIFPYLHHSPNGGFRHYLEAKKFKRMGTSAGFPDIFIYWPKDGYHGLAIELKRMKGSNTTKEQKEWLGRLNLMGYRSEVAYGFEDAKKIVEDYFK